MIAIPRYTISIHQRFFRYNTNLGIYGLKLNRLRAILGIDWQNHALISRNQSGFAGEKERKKKKQTLLSVAKYGRRESDRRDRKLLCEGCGIEIARNHRQRDASKVSFGESVENSLNDTREKGKLRFFDPFRHKSGKISLCSRCRVLQFEGRVGKGKNWKAYDVLEDVEPKVFEEQLKYIVSRKKYGMCIQVVDASDVEGSTISSLRKLIGKVPVMLAINKIDLLPGNDELGYEVRYLKQRAEKIGTQNVLGAYGVSATIGEGVYELALAVLRNLRGNDVFIVGAANVGKSTLVRQLTSILADALQGDNEQERRAQIEDWDGATESHLPGTTLQAIRIPCFSSEKHALWDTPGIIYNASLAYHNFPSHLMEPLARPEPIIIQPNVFQVPPGFSLLISASWIKGGPELHPVVLARIDVLECESRFVEVRPFLRPHLKVKLVRTVAAPETTIPPHSNEKEYLKELCPHVKLNSIDNEKIFKSRQQEPNVGMDVVFASLGWLSCHSYGNYILDPRCIKGSRFYKRVPRLYSKSRVENILEGDQNRQSYQLPPKSDAYFQALKDAAKDGQNVGYNNYYLGSEKKSKTS